MGLRLALLNAQDETAAWLLGVKVISVLIQRIEYFQLSCIELNEKPSPDFDFCSFDRHLTLPEHNRSDRKPNGSIELLDPVVGPSYCRSLDKNGRDRSSAIQRLSKPDHEIAISLVAPV